MAGPDEAPPLRCGSCGNDLRARARFCDSCGYAVASAIPGEHKQITVLFADVVGSMRLAAALHPERLQAIMHELFNRAAAVVHRFQGTVDKFTGDGLMALFGAPVALEDHALRACIAALEIQAVTKELAVEVRLTDGVDLRLRVGLNSGGVIAGEIGSGPGRYTAVGHPVGMAQRMESAATPGGVLCSESTARLVERSARLGPPTAVSVKGADEPAVAREVLGVKSDRMVLGRSEGELIGRDSELRRLMTAFDACRGASVGVIGEAGLGKTRLVAQFMDYAAGRNARVVVARCEAHTTEVSFRVMARLMRAMFGVEGLSREEARAHAGAQVPDLPLNSDDARILFDAMGVHDDAAPVELGAEGRRRRLADMMARAVRAHAERTVIVLEDLHWIDGPSDDVIAAFIAAMSPANALFVMTYRPEFDGTLHHNAAETIVLRALEPPAALRAVCQILGTDPSVAQLGQRIAHAAAGNPYFAEEIVRDLAGRGVLDGSRGSYRVSGDIDCLSVPPTVQAVLAARIDRLTPQTKSILNAAAVIGTQFDVGTLQLVHPAVTSERLAELVAAELVDQTEFLPVQRFRFHHPLVRTVAYDSQLHSTRARTHITLAETIQRREAFSDERAAMVAAHLEAAGDLIEAYRWHMRAADWLRPRDLPAARAQWDSARRIADRLPGDDPDALGMRIPPRTLLLSTLLYVRDDLATDDTYRELRELCTRNGDDTSLAVAMAGRIFSITVNDGRADLAAPMADELLAMATRLHCDDRTRGLVLNSVAFTKWAVGDLGSARTISDDVIALAPSCPNIEIAPALTLLGIVQMCSGEASEGRRSLEAGIDLTRSIHPVSFASLQIYAGVLIALGLLDPNDVLADAHSAWRAAESFGDLCGIVMSRWAYGTILLRMPGTHAEGIDVLKHAQSTVSEHRLGASALATIATDLAVEKARAGRTVEAIGELRGIFERTVCGFPVFAVFPAEALVDLLIGRGTPADISEAKSILDRWRGRQISVPALNLWLSRAESLIAAAEGDSGGYDRLAGEYLRQCERLNAVGRLDQARHMATATTR